MTGLAALSRRLMLRLSGVTAQALRALRHAREVRGVAGVTVLMAFHGVPGFADFLLVAAGTAWSVEAMRLVAFVAIRVRLAGLGLLRLALVAAGATLPPRSTCSGRRGMRRVALLAAMLPALG